MEFKEFPLLDYEQVEIKLEKIVNESNGKIKRQENIGVTDCNLPIRHYTYGVGENHIVVIGAMHGNEVITTDFVLKLMEQMYSKNNYYGFLNPENYTIDFVPMLNPEGYLISTTAIRKEIPRDMPVHEAEMKSKEYWLRYKNDDIAAINEKKAAKNEEFSEEERNELRKIAFSLHHDIKLHQKMFKDATWKDIPEKYSQVRESVRQIYENYPDLQQGSMIDWSANASGVDLNANSRFNPNIERIINGEVLPNNNRYNNLNKAHPGPIGCPFDITRGDFQTTTENLAMEKLFAQIKQNGKIISILNYHGTEGSIYQRPSIPPVEMQISKEMFESNTMRNYLISKFYQDKTYKGDDRQGVPMKYSIHTEESHVTCKNDEWRNEYRADLLVELSGMGGNPIAPYGDLDGNYTKIVNSNIAAVANSLEIVHIANMVADSAKDVVEKFLSKEDDLFIQNPTKINMGYSMLDAIYEEFSKKVDQIRWNSQKLRKIIENPDVER